MRIVCPACQAAYEVPVTLLAPGQAVRCARCAREWVPEPASGLAAPSPAYEPPPPQVSPSAAAPEPVASAVPAAEADILPARPRTARRPVPVPPPPRNTAVRFAWAATVLLIAVLLWGGYTQREAIMQAWPPSVRVYDALGLSAPR